VVVGAGIIGCEYGSMFATLGTEVTLIDCRTTLLEFVDREIVDALTYHLRTENMTLHLGEEVTHVFIDERDRIVTELNRTRPPLPSGRSPRARWSATPRSG
jgi:NAD(P) transhydrogenase